MFKPSPISKTTSFCFLPNVQSSGSNGTAAAATSQSEGEVESKNNDAFSGAAIQFYSPVDFNALPIGCRLTYAIKDCSIKVWFFTNTQSRVVSMVIESVLGPLYLARHTPTTVSPEYFCSY